MYLNCWKIKRTHFKSNQIDFREALSSYTRYITFTVKQNFSYTIRNSSVFPHRTYQKINLEEFEYHIHSFQMIPNQLTIIYWPRNMLLN